MLKTLIQTLLEAFLSSKKEWASNQSFPSATGYIDLPFDFQNENYFVPPCDGYITLYAAGFSADNSSELYVQDSPVKASSYGQWGLISVPCTKGSRVRYYSITKEGANTPSVRFYKAVGSV